MDRERPSMAAGSDDEPYDPAPTPDQDPAAPEPAGPVRRIAKPPDSLRTLRELGQTKSPPQTDPDIHFLSIIGQIEGHVLLPPKNKTTKYEHIMPQLVAIEQDPKIKGLLVALNTVGGDIEAGLALAELIRSLSKPTVSLVLGGGHSIGAPIAAAADYSFIVDTATVTIHPIRLTGLVIGVPSTYEYLDKMQDRVIRFIVENSKVSQKTLREAMFRTGDLVRDVGTVLIGGEAVTMGLIDEVGGLSDAVAKVRELMQPGNGAPDRWGKRMDGGPVKKPAEEVGNDPLHHRPH